MGKIGEDHANYLAVMIKTVNSEVLIESVC